MPPLSQYRSTTLCSCRLALILLLMASCRSTKYVPDDAYLLKSYRLKVDREQVSTKELNSYIKPKPNREILGM